MAEGGLTLGQEADHFCGATPRRPLPSGGAAVTDDSTQFIWYWATTAILAFALYFPTNRLIWVMRVRRLQKSLGRDATEEEREEVKRKTRLVAAILVIGFAYLFNWKVI